MGAELISAVIEIERGVKPDWAKAERFIQDLPDVEMMNLHSDILGLGEEFSAEDLSDIVDEVKKVRQNFIDALLECKSGWENFNHYMNRIQLHKSVILLAAGESWGDNVPQCDSIYLFSGCGAAKAAGFY
jgi:hypothetical protein